MTPEWTLQVLWFGAGIGGTGALWYFLSQRDYHTALWTGFGTLVVMLLATALHIRNDLLKREQNAADSSVVAQPMSDSTITGRPNVFFKWTKLYEPLGKSDKMAIEIWLSNSGTEDAKGGFTGISFRFEPAPYSKPLEYQTGGENGTFTLAPFQDTYIRLGSTLRLTPEMIKALTDDPPRARLYIFARGWYSDIAGTKTYELPLCRVYHPTMPGNLIYCPDDVTVKDTQEKEKPD